MNLERLRQSSLYKLLGDLRLLGWIVGILAPVGAGIASALQVHEEPIEIQVLYGFLATVIVFSTILFGLMKWENYQETQEKGLPMAQRTFAEARIGHRFWKWSKKNF